MLEEIHSHLIRSPPPITWPEVSPRGSAGLFSPDSGSECNDFESKNHKIGINRPEEIGIGGALSPPIVSENLTGRSEMVNRSHSEEHILSPSQEVAKSQLFSPVRGATPDYLNGT